MAQRRGKMARTEMATTRAIDWRCGLSRSVIVADSAPVPLEHALAEYRAAITLYPSAHEKALLKIIGTLAEEVIVLRGNSSGQARFNQSANPPSASDVQALRAEIAELRRHMDRNLPTPARSTRNARPVTLVGGLAAMRPAEELIDDVPQIEQELSAEQLKAHLKRPRVRAEDIVLSPDDLERQTVRRRRLRVSSELKQRLYEKTDTPDLEKFQPLWVFSVVVIIIIMVWILNSV